jgi:dTDP-4-amino-4,6-dideoxygalactose transaminase
LLSRLGIFPVRRGAGDLDAIATAVEFARQGHAVGIFPDGHPRSAARELTTRLMDAIAQLEAGLRPQARRPPRRLFPRLLIDITLGDLLYALGACLVARRRGREARVLRAWSGGERGLVCLSVRSALELLLQSLDLEEGDEVVVSAVTHPDMVRIIESHGLRVLPVDLDLRTNAPRLDVLERAINPRTRLVLVAHLFGSRIDLASLAEVVRRHRLLLVEDSAQAYRGPNDSGDALADVALFSFGPIKTSTALGGSLARVEDSALRARMCELQEHWPVQPRSEYARRVLKFVGLALLARPRVYSLFARTLELAGKDLDDTVGGAVRGFPGPDLTARIRRRPSAPLLALLERRLRAFDGHRLRRRAAVGERVAGALPRNLVHPGRAARDRTHWVFPVLTPNPAPLVASLLRSGFDAATGTSGIAAVDTPPDRPDLEPENAKRMLAELVFLPVYPELEREVDRLVAVLNDL